MSRRFWQVLAAVALCFKSGFAAQKQSRGQQYTIVDWVSDIDARLLRNEVNQANDEKRLAAMEEKTKSDPYQDAIKQRDQSSQEERLQTLERAIRDLQIKEQLRDLH